MSEHWRTRHARVMAQQYQPYVHAGIEAVCAPAAVDAYREAIAASQAEYFEDRQHMPESEAQRRRIARDAEIARQALNETA